jgi:hypothetical protein
MVSWPIEPNNRKDLAMNGLAKPFLCAAFSITLTSVQVQAASDLDCDGCVNTRDLDRQAVKEKNIARKAVTPSRLSAPAGAAGTRAKSRHDVSDLTTAQKISIVTPQSGVVVINASMGIRFESAVSSIACGLAKKVTLSGPLIGVSGSNISNEDNLKPFGATRSFIVKNPGKSTYYLVCNPAPGATVDLLNATLTATYAPTNIVADP